jgi:hypothetical protein
MLQTNRRIKAGVLILFLVGVAYASALTGPEPGYTNAPGDIGNCTVCHDHPGQINVGSGSVRVDGVPAVYETGRDYTLTVRVQHGGRIRFGFQLTAIDGSGSRAGTLSSLGEETQVITGSGVLGNRQYAEHTQPGTSGSVNSHTWEIRWTAPSSDIGPVTFYVAGNAADNSGTNQGDDFIYTSSVPSDSPTSVVTLALLTQPDNQTLQTGSKFTINWAATGGSNLAGYELRYSTDDGATFPISNLIFSTTNTSVTSYEWTVPDTPTTQARLRVQASSQSGSAVNAISGRFTITDQEGGGVPLPQIFGASVSGKKLIVTGADFGFGAKLFIDGAKQKKTSNDELNPTTVLIGKKAGKLISRGQTVTLQVENPDGSMSAGFSYTRPVE